MPGARGPAPIPIRMTEHPGMPLKKGRDPRKESDLATENLRGCLQAKQQLELVPLIFRRTITFDLWRVREPAILDHQRKEFRTFPEYCEAAGPWGLAVKFETIKKLCADERRCRTADTRPA